MPDIPPVKLRTARFILKQPSAENAADLFLIYGNRETMRFMQAPPAASVAECRELILEWNRRFCDGSSFRWGVFPSDDSNRMIGTAALHYWSRKNRRIELGADLNPDHQGQGIATEVTAALIELAFNALKVNRIELRCHPGNTASVVIAGKLGFRFEGILRQYVMVPGKGMVDEAVYSLLADDRQPVSDRKA